MTCDMGHGEQYQLKIKSCLARWESIKFFLDYLWKT